MNRKFLAIVNPAAGGGRCGQLVPAALQSVRDIGIDVEVAQTRTAGEATVIAREAYAKGTRNFLAAGGDGTSYEIINGLFPEAQSSDRPTLGFLPLGTGNSFLRDFTTRGVDHTLEVLKTGAHRACDVIRLQHAHGQLFFMNLFSLGFPADVGELTNRRFKRWGELGYILGVFTELAGLQHHAFPYQIDQSGEWDRRPCLFLSFNTSKFTGGKMMIAPRADAGDGLIECVRWSPVGRLRLLTLFPQLFTGEHINHPLASRSTARTVDFDIPQSVSCMIDGEILHLQPESLEILPAALDVFV
jgi:YegS/Rv2252/BmrU family lipid kinase